MLDKSVSQIPTGYLLDYSLAPFNDSLFNSAISGNIDTITESGQFFSLHNIFTLSAVNANATLGSTDSLFINAYRYQRNTSTIPVLLLYQQYQKISPTALSQNLFSVTSDSLRLNDVVGRPNSPYNTKTFFPFTPLQNTITQFNNITFSFPSQFWLMAGINSVSVDFGDGLGFRSVSQGGSLSVSYNTLGAKYITAIITTAYSDK